MKELPTDHNQVLGTARTSVVIVLILPTYILLYLTYKYVGMYNYFNVK